MTTQPDLCKRGRNRVQTGGVKQASDARYRGGGDPGVCKKAAAASQCNAAAGVVKREIQRVMAMHNDAPGSAGAYQPQYIPPRRLGPQGP